MAPRVTIITPVYNDEQFVAETLDSVAQQTLGEWEHIIVDDGSSDSSAEIISRYCERDPRMTLIRQENAGAGAARAAAYRQAGDSEFVLFLDHDDVLEPEMLASLVGYLDGHPEVDVAYCDFRVVDAHGRQRCVDWTRRFRAGLLSVSYVPPTEPSTSFEALLMWGGILPSNALIRRSTYDRLGGFDSSFFNDDTDLFMRIALQGTIHYLNRPLMLYRRHAGQMSADADQTSAELDRMLAQKWQAAELSEVDRRRLERGLSLRRYGAPALQGLVAATQRVRAGRLVPAARFLGGAARCYMLYVATNLGLLRLPPLVP